MLRKLIASRYGRRDFNEASQEENQKNIQSDIDDYHEFLRLGFDEEEASIYLRRGIAPPRY